MSTTYSLPIGQNPTKKVFHTVDIQDELDPVDLAILTLLQQKYSLTIIFPNNKAIPPPPPELKQLVDYFINRKQNRQNSNSQSFSKTDLEKSSYTHVNTPQDSLISFDDNTNVHEFTPRSQQTNKYNDDEIFGLAKRPPIINTINNHTPVSVNSSHDKPLKDLISNNNVPQQLVVKSPINDNYVTPSINSSFTVEPQKENNYPAETVSNQGYWNENDSNQVDWTGSIGQKENTNSSLKKGRIDFNPIYHDQSKVINDEFSGVTKQDTNDKLVIWYAAPDETFQSMERKFRESKCNVRIIALDRGEVPADKTLVDIQGHVGKKYFAHIMIGPPACIPIDYGQIAQGDGENNSWLADAGFLKDKNSIEMCITCNKSGHSSNNCPKIKKESNQESFTSLSCQSCGSTGHTTKSCNRGVDDTSRSNSERSERRYSRSSNTGSSGVNNNNNNIEKAATTWGETANLDNVAVWWK
nr:3119_t:CDS:2 [Entrophospora candida]CAG8520970.1 14603_t:CDS:2 [Entrophospora candida]